MRISAAEGARRCVAVRVRAPVSNKLVINNMGQCLIIIINIICGVGAGVDIVV